MSTGCPAPPLPETDVLEVHGLRAVAAGEDLEVGAQVVAGLPEQLGASGQNVDLPDVLVGGPAVDPAVALANAHEAGPARDGVAQGAARRPFDFEAAEPAVIDAKVAVGFLGGPARDVADRAAVGVAPEQGALGALEHLDPLHVVELGAHEGQRGLEHLVDEQPHARRVAGLEAVHAHTAQRVDGHGIAPGVLDVEIGRQVRHLGHVGPAEILQVLPAEGVDGDGDVLQVALPLGRRDYDLLDFLRRWRVCRQYGHPENDTRRPCPSHH